MLWTIAGVGFLVIVVVLLVLTVFEAGTAFVAARSETASLGLVDGGREDDLHG